MVSRYIPNHHLAGKTETPFLEFAPFTEAQLLRHFERLAGLNQPGEVIFAGGGAYDHTIPLVADLASSLRNLLTSYTQYQPELTQGYLQILFAYQTMIAELTGMDFAVNSLYEGGTALAEAALMALRIGGKEKRAILIPETLNPLYREVLETYLVSGAGITLRTIPKTDNGVTDWSQLPEMLRANDVAAVVAQQPNFFGCAENLYEVGGATHKYGALLIVSQYPVSMGMLKPPGEIRADIAVGELQSLGLPLSWGGPYAGYLATRLPFIDQAPGRLVEETRDVEGKRAYVLTQTKREQHIRRKRATSNICSNQALATARVVATLAAWGNRFAKIAERCYDNAHYLADRITSIDGFALRYPNTPYFNEFVIATSRPGIPEWLHESGFRVLTKFQEPGCFMVAVTEKHSRKDFDRCVAALKQEALRG